MPPRPQGQRPEPENNGVSLMSRNRPFMSEREILQLYSSAVGKELCRTDAICFFVKNTVKF